MRRLLLPLLLCLCLLLTGCGKDRAARDFEMKGTEPSAPQVKGKSE